MFDPNNAPIGQLIDAQFRHREQRMKKQKEADAIKKKENYLQELIIARLSDQGMTKGSGDLATASIKTETLPSLEDYTKLKRWCIRHKDTEIFTRRLHKGHWEEVIKSNPRGIPGIGSFDQTKLSLTASKK